jgi:hypothetical protein
MKAVKAFMCQSSGVFVNIFIIPSEIIPIIEMVQHDTGFVVL